MKPLPQIADYIIPHSLDLECQIITEIAYAPEFFTEVMRLINEDTFFCEECKKIYKTLLSMYDNHESISLMTLMPRCNRAFFTENIVGRTPYGTGESIRTQCMSLYDISVKRLAYVTAVTALMKIGEGKTSIDIEELFNTFGQKVADNARDTSFKDSYQIANALADDLANGRRVKFSTGIYTLDEMTYGGFSGGQLIILSARPSVGKTTIAMQWAQLYASMGLDTLVFSLEMTDKELMQRMILASGKINTYELMNGIAWSKYDEAVNQVCSPHLLINDKSRTLADIKQKIKLKWQEGKCRVALIDYLGLIPTQNSRATIAQQIGEITRELKAVAKECDIPIILLCQLNRLSASEGRPPQVYDLRDSGCIEQDADIILMLDKGKDKMGELVENSIDMYVRKDRGGKVTFGEPIHLLGNEIYSNFVEIDAYENR